MSRKRLPNLRQGETFEFPHRYPNADLRIFTASVGCYPDDGTIGEVFIHAADGKERTLNVDQHDATILLSFALQHGAKLEDLAKAMLRGAAGEPHGFLGALVDKLVSL